MGKWTRRAFITSGVLAGGAVIFGVAIRPGNRATKVAPLIAEGEDTVFNIWVKISPDNTVTGIIPHSEMGQGVLTSLGMMLADEMDVDWKKMDMIEAPAHEEYANYALAKGFMTEGLNFPGFLMDTIDGLFLMATKSLGLQITGGSGSVRFTGMAMRMAGAAAKATLLQAAANQWQVPVSELTARNSHIHHQTTNRSSPYADFAQEAAKLDAPAQPTLKTPDEFTIMGTEIKRRDTPSKVNGSARFGIDVQLPDMKIATVKASPVFGAMLSSVDQSGISAMQGVHKVVELEDAVAVIADDYWTARKAIMQLDVSFEPISQDQLSSEDIYAQFSKDLDEADQEKDIRKGNLTEALEQAAQVIEAEYRVPYLAHATMEPMNCTVWLQKDRCDVWVGTQNPLGYVKAIAEWSDLQPNQIHVHNHFMGGGFGRRGETDVLKQAFTLAKEVPYPVKLIWSREEDMQHDVYRDANVSRFVGALDANGLPIGWKNQYVDKHHPAEATHLPYSIPNQDINYVKSATHIPWGNWRSVDHSLHGFFIESFVDELAAAAKRDPYLYRQQLLQDNPRFLAVLDLAAEKANWGSPLPENWGRGIALHASFGTIVAEVVEVEVLDGNIRVHRVVCAADPGFAVHPNGFKAQMESGIIYGLTAALYGEITIENGAVKQSNFHNYKMVRMSEAPTIETYVINSGAPIGGAGEPGTPGIAPAVANAVFDATGKRMRSLPLQNQSQLLADKG